MALKHCRYAFRSLDLRGWSALAAGLVLGLFAGIASAAPWDNLFTFTKVDADPQKDYRLTERNGPWLIMACSFSGDRAEEQAKELVLELRQRYKLKAYLYEKEFRLDRGTGGRNSWRYRSGDEIREIAVLVGDFSSVDDPAAQQTLQKIKFSRPQCLEARPDAPTSRTLAALRTIQQSLLTDDNEKKHKGPMGHAFLTANPLLPDEYFKPNGVDKFLLELNDGYEYNLLNCPGRYTVQVAHFTGEVVIDQAKIRAIERGEAKFESKLAEAARRAHELTLALRAKGYEAYEFHDRAVSIVTVGSFDSLGTPRADGKTELDPRIVAIMKTFAAEPIAGPPGVASVGYQPKRLVDIPFDLQPMIVETPKRSVGADYAGRR